MAKDDKSKADADAAAQEKAPAEAKAKAEAEAKAKAAELEAAEKKLDEGEKAHPSRWAREAGMESERGEGEAAPWPQPYSAARFRYGWNETTEITKARFEACIKRALTERL